MKIISRNVLATALAAALLSPAALAQSGNSARSAQQQVQEVPRAPLPPPVAQRLPINQDPRTPPTTDADLQRNEAPMTSKRPTPPPQVQSHSRAADQSAVAMQNQWTTLDADRDGRISAAEAAADQTFNRDFATIDADDDGFISPEEHRDHVRRMAGKGDSDRALDKGDMPSQAQGPERAAAHASVAQRELWSELDTDGDGRISSVESSMDAQFGARFRAMDADGDGYVDAGEYRTYAQQDRTSFTGDADFDDEATGDDTGDTGNEDPDQPVDDERDGG